MVWFWARGRGHPQGMKPHAHLRVLSALVGGAAVLGMGLVVATESPRLTGPRPVPVLAPDTLENDDASWATTSSVLSFSPRVIASIPPPPED